jgi:DNA-binding beta-propeller fold protein YncE
MMERCVALKTIGRDLDARPELVERFRREVKAAARLSHPNIVAAYDAEQAGRTHFLVMEYVEGIDLARLVAQRGKLPIEEACEYVRQASLGLQHAHEKGMIHRDIKPHNLMVTPAGQVKILDFGLALFAREAGSESDALTSHGVVMGTADYMAPEQASDSHHADIRADIYSLGCTLYHLLTGHVPFPKGTFLDKVVRHATKKPTPISQLRSELPSELVRVVERMMAKKPEQRYQTPAEVAQALAPFAKGHTSTSVAPDRAALFSGQMPSKTEIESLPPIIGHSRGTPVPVVRPRHRQRRSRFVALTLLVLLLGGVIAGAAAIYRIQTDEGELVITTESDDVKVVISQGGKLVDVIDTKTDKQIRLALRSGVYELELKGAPEGLKLNIDKATLTHGETKLAKIERVKPAPPEKVGEIRRFIFDPNPICWVTRAEFSPDGRRVVAAAGKVHVWDAASGEHLAVMDSQAFGWGLALAPDGKIAYHSTDDGVVHVYDLEQAKEVGRLDAPDRDPSQVQLSADGKRILISAIWPKKHRLCEVPWGKELGKFEGCRAALSPDGTRVALIRDKRIVLWDIASGKEVGGFAISQDDLAGTRFSPDGRFLVAGGLGTEENVVRLWDVATGKERSSFTAPTQKPLRLAVSPDSRRILCCSDACSPMPDPPIIL